MPKYAITRTWSLAGWVTSEVEAESEEAARRIEEERWETIGALPSLPSALKQHIEEVFEDIEDVSLIPS